MFNIKSILFSAFALLSMSFSAYADNSYGLKSNIQMVSSCTASTGSSATSKLHFPTLPRLASQPCRHHPSQKAAVPVLYGMTYTAHKTIPSVMASDQRVSSKICAQPLTNMV